MLVDSHDPGSLGSLLPATRASARMTRVVFIAAGLVPGHAIVLHVENEEATASYTFLLMLVDSAAVVD